MLAWYRSTGIGLITILLTSLTLIACGRHVSRGLSDTTAPQKMHTAHGKAEHNTCEKVRQVCHLKSHSTWDDDPGYGYTLHSMRTGCTRGKLGLMGVTPGSKQPMRSQPCATASIVKRLDYDTSGLMLAGKHTVAECCPTETTDEEGCSRIWRKKGCRYWYRVRTQSGKEGWIPASRIGSITAAEKVTGGFKRFVNGDLREYSFRKYTKLTAQDEAASSSNKLTERILEDLSSLARAERAGSAEDKTDFKLLSLTVLDEDQAVAIFYYGPFLDDSGEGERYAFYMKRNFDEEAGRYYWIVDYAMMRDVCRRGVSMDNRCF